MTDWSKVVLLLDHVVVSFKTCIIFKFMFEEHDLVCHKIMYTG